MVRAKMLPVPLAARVDGFLKSWGPWRSARGRGEGETCLVLQFGVSENSDVKLPSELDVYMLTRTSWVAYMS